MAAEEDEAQLLGGSWSAEGPGPLQDGQVEGITNEIVIGAINSVAAHPTDADILYVGAVNGGIWKTTNATAASVQWTQQAGTQTSLSIGTVDFDPTDATHQTLVAGSGRFSSFLGRGGDRIGLLRTTDGGSAWTLIDNGMAGRNIVGAAPRGATLVVAVDNADSFSCGQIGIWRSTNTGATWSRATGIPRGVADALAGDPTDSSILYASIVFASACDGASKGIYKSTDTGATWSKVSDAAMDALLSDSSGNNVDIAVGTSNNVFVALIPSGGRLGGVFRSGNGGTSWTALDLPGTVEQPGSGFVGAHAGGQGSIHSSLAADFTDANVVYLGGDRQPRGFQDQGSFPNSLGARDFSGRLFRGDASLGTGSQFTALTHSGTASNSSPHADSRDMAVDAAGNLIEVDDGGIYKRTSPRSSTGDWFSLNGDLQTTESHNMAYDAVSDILMVGNQDTGTGEQILSGDVTWDSVHTGDGGDVLIDSISTPGMSTRYSSFQNLGNFRRRVYNAANQLQSQVFPAMTPVGGGAAFSPQFVTPTALNHVDGTRIIFGGSNGLYESMDQGDTIEEIAAGLEVTGFSRDTISAGATGNAEVLYVGGCIGSCGSSGDGADGVFVRTSAGGALTISLSASASGEIQGVAGDPGDPSEAFAIDGSTVFYTANTGTSWSDITGNLASFVPGTLQAVEYLSDGSIRAVVVGGDRGVYLALESDGFSTWYALGTGLPNVPVSELNYDSASNTLYAGTLGRGVFSIPSVLGNVTFGLTVSVSGSGSGTVTSAPTGISCPGDCTESYSSGTVVTLTATPATGSIFAGWSGDADCSDGQVTMNSAVSCDAQFEPQVFTLTVSTSGGGSGTVTSSPGGIACPGDCSQSYASGTVVTLTATPTAGSTFAGWSGDADCSDGQVTMNSAVSCDAQFDTATFALSVSTSGSGSGTVTSAPSGISCPGDCSESYSSGTVVTLTATPAAGSTFAGWSGDADCSDGQVTMNSAVSCDAQFDTTTTFTLSVSTSGSGTGTVTSAPSGIACPGDCSESYSNGTAVTLTATPAAGSIFAGWSGDADCSDGQVTMNSAVSCDARFELQAFGLTVSTSGDGSGTVTSTPGGISCPGDCSQSYLSGTVVTLTATPEAGSTFAGWSGDADCFDGQVTMNSAVSCDAQFDATTTFTLSVSTSGDGSGTVTSAPSGIACPGDCTESYSSGTAVTLTATPAAGSTFAGWSGDADCSDGQVTMNSAVSCDAQFDTTTITLSVSTSGSGTGTVTSAPSGIACPGDCTEPYSNGTVVTLTATPAAGSIFAGWSGDVDCSDGQVTMNSAVSCNAQFELQAFGLTVSTSGDGSGTVTSTPGGISCPGDCSQSYLSGTVVTLTATPDAGSTFVGWTGDTDCSDGQVTMTATTSCDAQFSSGLQTLAIQPVGSGSGTVTSTPTGIDCPEDCSANFPSGTTVELAAVAAGDSVFVRWGGDADCRDGSVLMDSDHTCTAEFVLASEVIFRDGFETGSTSEWSLVVGASPRIEVVEDPG